MISIENLSKKYGNQFVLEQINLNLDAGKTHVILGSSGCGKSTLLKILMGLVKQDSGRATINDIEVTTANRRKIALQTGYVIQDAGLFPHLTAESNISLLMKTLGTPQIEIEKRVRELTELVGLEPLVLKHYPKELSGGQKQRVGLVRALMMNPATLLLDEPLGALDPVVRSKLQAEIKRICNSLKKTVILITHDLGEAAYFGHTITLMDGGKIIQHGTFNDLVKSPKSSFVTEFLKAQRPPKELAEIL